eukprot:TRINITY_DN3143_c0_g3_i2.p1 TRINITY_DN3143_c0_g3~~TRINITY_DN3143_c0_g3_i2.p1  ORF type:complete len:656 (-),score=91.00 TRINITY_DN3143_c0_g3_i2:3123-5090(-)
MKVQPGLLDLYEAGWQLGLVLTVPVVSLIGQPTRAWYSLPFVLESATCSQISGTPRKYIKGIYPSLEEYCALLNDGEGTKASPEFLLLACLHCFKISVLLYFGSKEFSLSPDRSGEIKIEMARFVIGSTKELLWTSVVPTHERKEKCQRFSSGHIQETLGYLEQINKYTSDFKKQIPSGSLEMFNQVKEGIQNSMLDLSQTERSFGFLGDTKVGKSFLMNLMLALSEVDNVTYTLMNFMESEPQDIRDCAAYLYLKDNVDENLIEVFHLPKNDSPPPYVSPFKVEADKVVPKPYLLASSGRACATTTVNTKVKWGTRFHMLLDYYTEEEMYTLLDCEDCTDEYKNASALILENITHLRDVDIDDWPKREDIHFKEDIKNVLGRKKIYYGGGESAFEDRAYIKSKYEELQKDPTLFAVKECVLFVPCEIVAGNVTLWDIPGCNDSNPFRKDQLWKALNEVQLLFTLTNTSLPSSETVRRLLKEIYVPRMLKDKSLQLGMLLSLEGRPATRLPNKEVFEENLEECVESKKALLSIMKELERDVKRGKSAFTAEDIQDFRENRIEKIPSISAWPMYFCCNATKIMDTEEQPKELLWSGGYELLGLIENFLHRGLNRTIVPLYERMERFTSLMLEMQECLSDSANEKLKEISTKFQDGK